MVRRGVLVFLILLALEANAMALNEEGMAMTKRFEGGFKPNMYQIQFDNGDGVVTDVPTIGYGFNMAANNLTNPVMTQQEADALFPTIYQQALDRAAAYAGPTWATLSPVQQNILTDMSYNLGNRLSKFVDMQAALQGGNLAGVPAEMINSKWYKQVGNRSKGLVDMWNQSLAPAPVLAPTLANPEAPRKVKTGRRVPNA